MKDGDSQPLTFRHLLIAGAMVGAMGAPVTAVTAYCFSLGNRVTALETAKGFQEERNRELDKRLESIDTKLDKALSQKGAQ
jgi:hypothetical protein